MDNIVNFSTRIDKDVRAKLDLICKKQGKKMQFLINDILSNYINDLEEKEIEIQEIVSFGSNKGIYFLKGPNNYFKIGHSKCMNMRIKEISQYAPFETKVFAIFECDDHLLQEKKAHKHFEDKKIRKEWFKLTDEEVLEYIKLLNDEVIKK